MSVKPLVLCPVGESDASQEAKHNAYKKDITDYLKENFKLYFRVKVEESMQEE